MMGTTVDIGNVKTKQMEVCIHGGKKIKCVNVQMTKLKQDI